MIDFKQWFASYKGKGGGNPVLSALSALTFVRTIPLQIAKAIIIAILLYVVMIVAFSLIGVKWVLFVIAIVLGLIGVVLITITASIRNIVAALLNTIADLLTSVLSPLDDMYDAWQEAGDQNLSKKDFMLKAMKEVVVPHALNLAPVMPFKKRIHQNVNSFVSTLAKTQFPEKEGSDVVEDDSTVLKRFITGIENSRDKSIKVCNKPMYWSISLFIILSCAFVLISLLLG